MLGFLWYPCINNNRQTKCIILRINFITIAALKKTARITAITCAPVDDRSLIILPKFSYINCRRNYLS